MIGGMSSFVGRGDTVLIKPNLVVPRTANTGITTDLTILEEVASQVIGEGAKPIIGESSSIGFDQDLTSFILGVRQLASRLGVRLVNFDKAPLTKFTAPDNAIVRNIKLPQIIADADLIINIPKLKTHELTGITVGLKNVLGFLPGKKKQWAHIISLDQAIVDLNKIVGCGLTIVDGLIAMEGNGPALGAAVESKMVIAGRNPVCVDEVACRAMGVDPSKVGHMRLAMRQLPYKRDGPKLVGNLKPKRFEAPTRSQMFHLVERMIFTLNYLLYSRFTAGGDALPRRARLRRHIPKILPSRCTGCGACAEVCPTNAIDTRAWTINLDKCLKCMICADQCNKNAIVSTRKTDMSGIYEFFGERVRKPAKLSLENCDSCGQCKDVCPADAIALRNGVLKLDTEKCIRCVDKFCKNVCKQNAIN
jgi:uncharacterized protein (DUF362 family)/formate hydrogenlyase subunit 6/NADH:ubiquinone oxidoreductase subunit I